MARSNVMGFRNITVNRFTKGSVIVDATIFFNGNVSDSATQDALARHAASNSTNLKVTDISLASSVAGITNCIQFF